MRLNDGRAIPAFMTQALTDAPITVFGDGSQTRSFQYVSDLVDGLWLLMERGGNDPVNIGNPQEMTLLELAKRIIRLAGSRSEIVFRPLPEDDPKVRQPDITRARTLLGWEPRVDTDEGLKLTLEYFRAQARRVRGVQATRGGGRMIDEELKRILVCPACKGDLLFEETRIICPACRKAYPIRDDIPVMLINEAQPWSPGT